MTAIVRFQALVRKALVRIVPPPLCRGPVDTLLGQNLIPQFLLVRAGLSAIVTRFRGFGGYPLLLDTCVNLGRTNEEKVSGSYNG